VPAHRCHSCCSRPTPDRVNHIFLFVFAKQVTLSVPQLSYYSCAHNGSLTVHGYCYCLTMTIELKRVMRYPITETQPVKTAAHSTNLTCGIYVQPRGGQHGTIICGSSSGSLFLWKINFRQGIDSFVLPHTELQRHSGPVRCLAHDPEHNLLFR
jgi:hypothetical protein